MPAIISRYPTLEISFFLVNFAKFALVKDQFSNFLYKAVKGIDVRRLSPDITYYFAGIFVTGMNDDPQEEWRSVGSDLLKRLDLLQQSPGYHSVRKTEDGASPQRGQSHRAKASVVTRSQGFPEALPQTLEKVKKQ